MAYRLMGLMHAGLGRLHRRQEGQGTVEYVALILLVAAILAGVVAATHGAKDGGGIAEAIVRKLKTTLDTLNPVKR